MVALAMTQHCDDLCILCHDILCRNDYELS
jgi:hypothetical protein